MKKHMNPRFINYKTRTDENEGTTEQTEMDNTENEVPPETRNEVRR